MTSVSTQEVLTESISSKFQSLPLFILYWLLTIIQVLEVARCMTVMYLSPPLVLRRVLWIV